MSGCANRSPGTTAASMDRGKVMTAEDLEAGKDVRPLSRCRWRRHHLPHLSRHASDARARSSPAAPRRTAWRAIPRKAPDYQENMERLLKKHRHRQHPGARPAIADAKRTDHELGAIYFGSTSPAMTEADVMLAGAGHPLDLLRVRGFPFGDEVEAFIAEHDQVFVVEQNRDGQLRSLLINELEIDPKKLVQGAALRRHADQRALHRRRHRRQSNRVRKACHDRSVPCVRLAVMTYLAKPKLHHPDLHEERARLHAARL